MCQLILVVVAVGKGSFIVATITGTVDGITGNVAHAIVTVLEDIPALQRRVSQCLHLHGGRSIVGDIPVRILLACHSWIGFDLNQSLQTADWSGIFLTNLCLGDQTRCLLV